MFGWFAVDTDDGSDSDTAPSNQNRASNSGASLGVWQPTLTREQLTQIARGMGLTPDALRAMLLTDE